MIRTVCVCVLKKKVVEYNQGAKKRMFMDLPVPSGPPRAYNISVGWKTSEECLGIKGEGKPRNGKLVSPVGILVIESGGSGYIKDRTMRR